MAGPQTKLQAMTDGELVLLCLSVVMADVSHREAVAAQGDPEKMLGAQRIGALAVECKRRAKV